MAKTKVGTSRQHAYTGPAEATPPEPSYAERARTLVSQAPIATLSTISRKHRGFPFGSLMPYGLDRRGRPLLLISSMAMHTQNLKADPRASLFVEQTADGDPLGAARVTLVGPVGLVPEDDIPPIRTKYLERHPNSSNWVDFADFSFYRMEPVELYYVGGFGVMGWVDAQDYALSHPDPLASSAASIMAHMNADHAASMILLARTYAGISATSATMTSVDRLGFWLRLKTKQGMKGSRINFFEEVSSAEETRKALIEMVRRVKVKSAL